MLIFHMFILTIIFIIIVVEVYNKSKKYIKDEALSILNNRMKEKITFDAELELIDSKELIFRNSYLNNKCHWNSFSNNINNENLLIIPCITIWKEGYDHPYPVVHFINYDKDSGKYIDDTYGGFSNTQEYYILPEIVCSKNSNMNYELNKLKKYFYNKYVSKYSWFRLFTNYNSI